MRNLKLVAVMSCVSLLTLAGAGNSSTPKKGIVRLADFVNSPETILGYAGNAGALGFYRRLESTQHLPGVGGPLYPPNPCIALTSVYNKIIDKVPEGPVRQLATRAVLRQMARRDCCVDLTRDSSVDETQEPAGIYALRPVPCAE